MPKLRDILLAGGYTEEELKGMDTLLSNPKFASTLQKQLDSIDSLTTERDNLQKTVTGDKEWYENVCVPESDKLLSRAEKAEADLASERARIEYWQKNGLLKVMEGNNPNPNPNPNSNPNPSNPNPASPTNMPTDLDKRFVSTEQFTKAYTEVGNTIIDAADIPDDHHELFGSRLPGGMRGLRAEYVEACNQRRFNGSLTQFWEQKYKVADKRVELEAKRKQEYEDSIRADERAKIAKTTNPMLSTPMPSRMPFTKATPSNGTGAPNDDKPWLKSREQRQAERVSKFAAIEASGGRKSA